MQAMWRHIRSGGVVQIDTFYVYAIEDNRWLSYRIVTDSGTRFITRQVLNNLAMRARFAGKGILKLRAGSGPIKVGSIVRTKDLKTGPMTVEDLNGDMVKCLWFDREGEARCSHLNKNSLNLIGGSI